MKKYSMKSLCFVPFSTHIYSIHPSSCWCTFYVNSGRNPLIFKCYPFDFCPKCSTLYKQFWACLFWQSSVFAHVSSLTHGELPHCFQFVLFTPVWYSTVWLCHYLSVTSPLFDEQLCGFQTFAITSECPYTYIISHMWGPLWERVPWRGGWDKWELHL